mgnify:CR=1 FL=1
MAEGKRVSCINPVQRQPLSLTGAKDFCGDFRFLALIMSGRFQKSRWNYADSCALGSKSPNGVDGIAPKGFEVGVEYNQEDINKALQAGTNEERKQIVKSQDFSGHGTAVAGVAAGSGSEDLDNIGRGSGKRGFLW